MKHGTSQREGYWVFLASVVIGLLAGVVYLYAVTPFEDTMIIPHGLAGGLFAVSTMIVVLVGYAKVSEVVRQLTTTPTPTHEWNIERTYDLPGPRLDPEVRVYKCSRCGMVKETSQWHDPSPQYFEDDTKTASRVTDKDAIETCRAGGDA